MEIAAELAGRIEGTGDAGHRADHANLEGPIRRQSPVLHRHRRICGAVDGRGHRKVAARRQRHIIGQGQLDAQGPAVAQVRHQQAAGIPGGAVRMGEARQIDNGNAQQLEIGVPVTQPVLCWVVDDLDRPDLPDRCPGASILPRGVAGRIDRTTEIADVVDAGTAPCRQSPSVLQHQQDILDGCIPQRVGDIDLVTKGLVAARVGDNDIAARLHKAGTAVIGHFAGAQPVFAANDQDIAGGGDNLRLVIIAHAVGGKIDGVARQRLCGALRHGRNSARQQQDGKQAAHMILLWFPRLIGCGGGGGKAVPHRPGRPVRLWQSHETHVRHRDLLPDLVANLVRRLANRGPHCPRVRGSGCAGSGRQRPAIARPLAQGQADDADLRDFVCAVLRKLCRRLDRDGRHPTRVATTKQLVANALQRLRQCDIEFASVGCQQGNLQ